MRLLFKECSGEEQKIIENRVELENKKTGYGMELEEGVTRTDRCIFYHMYRELDYEDYTVKIRNQGDYEFSKKSGGDKEFYAYDVVISSKIKTAPQMVYKLSSMMADYGYYDKLPTWEALQNFFESDDIKQLFAKCKEVHEKFITVVKSDLGVEDEE